MVKIKKYFKTLWFRLQGKELTPIVLSKVDELTNTIVDNRTDMIQMIHFQCGDESMVDVEPLPKDTKKAIKKEFKETLEKGRQKIQPTRDVDLLKFLKK